MSRYGCGTLQSVAGKGHMHIARWRCGDIGGDRNFQIGWRSGVTYVAVHDVCARCRTFASIQPKRSRQDHLCCQRISWRSSSCWERRECECTCFWVRSLPSKTSRLTFGKRCDYVEASRGLQGPESRHPADRFCMDWAHVISWRFLKCVGVMGPWSRVWELWEVP